ncbi:MAG: formate dehydrogenase [Betaproteobacteria bacterium]|nr:MAG: formate dehydrogenase [Betaproteobacteria bacterium]
MSQSHQSKLGLKLGRRQALAGAGAAGALAAAAVVLKTTLPDATAPPQPTGKPKPDEGGGYRVTEHVMRYYQTTKV